ncbi:NAD(P)-dependent oxidoreductase [Cesiribacter sp. SM1]|uniref:NAD-dependent epimerase/dehydratase family protein n=1 Tax=Cesiribacter sp. SM1 TaxID=2861196 RepID=UPI001CD59672|nr:NAD(P)-dependent oxidoreductase [Cesiribacter sp. SM1]
MKERVLITGANGFIGSHLVEAALQAGFEVFAGIRPGCDMGHLGAYTLQYTFLNYFDVADLQEELEEKQYHYIIHAAGTTKSRSEAAYSRINAEYTKNLGIAAVSAKIPLKKFVFISSLAALGPTLTPHGAPIDEQSVAKPLTAYGRSKLLAEKYLSKLENLPLVVLRPTAVYGPGEKDIFILLKTLNCGLDLHIGKGAQRLSFVYVKDLARVVIHALGSKGQQEIYNVSDGNCYDRYALADYVLRILDKRAIRLHLPVGLVRIIAKVMEKVYRQGSSLPALNEEKLCELTAMNWCCSIDHIRKSLGFNPSYNLEKGLVHTLRWYKENNWL